MKAVHTPGLANGLFADDRPEPQPGQFEVTTNPKSGQRRFWFVCPGPCQAPGVLALRPVVDGSAQSWDFDGNEAAPTLHPSINHIGCWHGWLRAGEFTSC
jgi:hypothetical protein